jgi:thiol-disulfide isomerase/thioredoxin
MFSAIEIGKTGVRTSFCVVALCLSTAAQAHEVSSQAPPLSPALKTASYLMGGVGVAVLVGLFVVNARQRAAHGRSGSAEPYSERGFHRALLGLLGAMGLAAITIRFVHARGLEESERAQALRANAEEAGVALNELLLKTPKEEQLALLKRVADSDFPGARYAALERVGTLVPAKEPSLFERAFLDYSGAVRELAVERLYDLDKGRGLRLMLQAIQDEDSQVRDIAAQRLARVAKSEPNILPKAIVPFCIGLLEASSPNTRASLSHLLIRLTKRGEVLSPRMTEEEQLKMVGGWRAWLARQPEALRDVSGLAEWRPVVPTRSAPAPELGVSDLNGQPIRIAKQMGRVTLLNFWGTWCGPCLVELPDLIRLNAHFQGQPFDLIGLALSEPEGEAGLRRWTQEQGVLYRQAICDRTTQVDYGEVTGVPVSFLLDKQGRIRYQWEGPRDFETFRRAVDRLLEEP